MVDVAREDDLTPICGRQAHIEHLHRCELLRCSARRHSVGTVLESRFERDLQGVGQETDHTSPETGVSQAGQRIPRRDSFPDITVSICPGEAVRVGRFWTCRMRGECGSNPKQKTGSAPMRGSLSGAEQNATWKSESESPEQRLRHPGPGQRTSPLPEATVPSAPPSRWSRRERSTR